MISIEKKLIEYLTSYFLRNGIRKKSRILIALSGGPDSVTLSSLLKTVSSDWAFSLFCGYLDHGIRKPEERNADHQIVQKTANVLNIPLFTKELKQGFLEKNVSERKESLEDAARRERYLFLKETAAANNCRYIALGHNADDQVETLIMRFFQGSGIFGLKGIPEKRDVFIRPMIDMDKTDIYNYLKLKKMGYGTDSTNLEAKYLRNNVRLNLIPEIKRVFPGFKPALLNFQEKIAGVQDYIRKQEALLADWEKADTGYRIFKSDFENMPPFLRAESIYRLYNSTLGKNSFRLPYRFLRPVLSVSSFKKDQTLLNGYGFTLKCRKEYIFWERVVVQSGKKSYLNEVVTGRNILLENYSFTVEEKLSGDEDAIILAKKDISYPLFLRSKRDGDLISMTAGTKSIKKLFNEWKVPLSMRCLIPVIEDRNGIVAVFGKPYGFFNRVAKQFYRYKKTDTEMKIVLTCI